ncbi:MAG: nuclear transport factor 2 family protein [Bacteroidetes bacterium]|nr:nuclear transport factor 2 family protein [Bacteroidota bacterium]MBS1632674.1 nuclear transport factor 2 family protein [Bacteroidota bacterium]
MKYFLIILTATLWSAEMNAQTAVDSVKAVINKMFDAMKNADGESLKTCFGDSVVFQTISRDKEGKIVVVNEDPVEFALSVSQLPKGAADERVRFETIKIDGALAIVWAPYNFYFNGKFSHCGMDSFQLVRFSDGWKIQYIIDTRRKDNCNKE